jgi:hypothetical protein
VTTDSKATQTAFRPSSGELGIVCFFCADLYLVGGFEDCGEKRRLFDDGIRTAQIWGDSDFEGLCAAGKTTL